MAVKVFSTSFILKHMLPTEKKPKSGFTLVEMLVVISVLGLIFAISSGFLFSSLFGSSKAEIFKEVRQNGSWALSVIEAMILNSRTVECESSKTLNITDKEGFVATIFCDDVTEMKIASNGANLTSRAVSVSDCSFVCEKTEGKSTKVDISFSVSQKSEGTLKPSEKARLDFSTTVLTRNY